MKILNLIQCANLGGMEQASLRLMRGLQAHGHPCRLLSLNPIGGLAPLLESAGIPHEGLAYAGRGGWRTMPQLRQRLRAPEADALLMTGHHLLGTLALGDFCVGHRVLAIHFHHGGVKPDWQWRLIYRVACSKFQAITFPADFIRKEAERIYPPVAALAQTIRYPLTLPTISTAEQKLAARRILGVPPEAQIIGNAGWLIPRKRFDVFLQTAALIAAQCPRAHFVIAGGGAEQPRLEALAASLKLTQRLTWTGWLQDMAPFYHSLDVLLFNSDWDTLPVTPQEAMSYTIPVVASVVHGGLQEIISTPERGFILDRHDVSALADEVLRLLHHPAQATQMGMAGRERIRAMSQTEVIAAEYERLLQGKVTSPETSKPDQHLPPRQP